VKHSDFSAALWRVNCSTSNMAEGWASLMLGISIAVSPRTPFGHPATAEVFGFAALSGKSSQSSQNLPASAASISRWWRRAVGQVTQPTTLPIVVARVAPREGPLNLPPLASLEFALLCGSPKPHRGLAQREHARGVPSVAFAQPKFA
jgi:hypothetical protein